MKFTTQKFNIKNRKDLNLAAVIEKPVDENIKAPFVLMFPGFTGYKEEAHFNVLAKKLKETEVGSLVFDPSGYGESQGNIKDDYRLSNYIEDAEDVYEWLIKQRFVRKDKIFTFGLSLGGIVSLSISAKYPNLSGAISALCPEIVGKNDMLLNLKADWKKTGKQSFNSSKYGKVVVPYEFLNDAFNFNASDYAKDSKVSQLYILGLDDGTVPPKETRKIFNSANEPKKLIELEGIDHFYKRSPEKLARVNKVIIDFIQKQL